MATATNKSKKRKTSHSSTTDNLARKRISSHVPGTKSREDTLLNILANNQSLRSQGSTDQNASDEPEPQPLPTKSSNHEDPEQATESAYALSRVKNATLPGLTKALDSLESYDLRVLSIISSTKIRNKVQQATQTITSASTGEAQKGPIVLVLTAREGVASKLVTIVEVTKRNLNDVKVPWYQYSYIEPKTIEIPRKTSNTDRHENASEDDDQDEGQPAFETMLPPMERKLMDKPKFRAVPIMTIFLSRSSIKELRDAYGYVARLSLNLLQLTNFFSEQTLQK